MVIRKLKGASQMVANMLKRDKLPARTEAAEELLTVVADVESEYNKLLNANKTLKRKLEQAEKDLSFIKEARP